MHCFAPALDLWQGIRLAPTPGGSSRCLGPPTVQGSLEQAKKDKEVNNAYRAAAMKKMLPAIRDVFIGP